jgi:PPM family protein phosphatase
MPLVNFRDIPGQRVIWITMTKIEFVGKTDVGLVRSNNEDAFIVNSEAVFCLVADGMGGAAAGETASRIFAQTADQVFPAEADRDEQTVLHSVRETFQKANDLILSHVTQHPEHTGMGCTAELMAFSAESLIIGHMGDSRTYLYREGQLRQLTKDHSFVQEQIDQGVISAEEARQHKMRNVILRAVGVRPSVELDTICGSVQPNDIFLLCSDGLTDMVEDAKISKILNKNGDLTHKAVRLVELAKQAGGKDNITVVLAHST